jgi:LPXTG-motif cell wall-anchored protein
MPKNKEKRKTMKKNPVLTAKVIQVILLLTLFMQTMVTPVTVLATTSNATENTMQETTASEEQRTSASETLKETTSVEPEHTTTEHSETASSTENAKANDSPNTETHSVEELLARENPYSAAGLSNDEIIALGQALFREQVKADPKMTVSIPNDQGEVIQIPFLSARAIATSENKYTDIQYSHVYQGWTVNSYIVEYKVDGKTAFCVDPTRTMYDGEYTPSTNYPFSNDVLTKANWIGSLYSTVGTDKYTYATAQLMIWEQLGAQNVQVNFGSYASIKAKINAAIASYQKVPSFAGNTLKLTVGQSLKLTDTNAVMTQFSKNQANTANVPYSVNGDVLTLTPTVSSKNGTLTFEKIQTLSTPLVYYKDNAQTLAVFSLKDTLNFSLNVQVEKNGKGRVIKKSDETDQPLSGAVYQVTNNKDSAIETLTTKADGRIETKNYEHGTLLTIREITAPTNHVLSSQIQTIQIEAGKTKEVTFHNKRQVGKVTLVKKDTETGDIAQGQASLENAVYGLYQADGTKMKEVTLKNVNGTVQASIENLQIEKDYYFKEITPPTGYNLSKEKIPFRIAYAGQELEVAAITETATDTVIKGNVDLLKFANYDWKTQAWQTLFGKTTEEIKKGLANVEFTIYENWGTHKKVATIQTDAQGYAYKQGLPYGKYYMEETKTPVGYKTASRIDFEIKEENQSFHYSIENKVQEAKVKIVKVDADTGKEIVRSNAGYTFTSVTTGQAYYELDDKGNKVTTFYTNDEGYLMMAHQFAFGEYLATEVQAPTGYVLAKEPIKFRVTGEEKDGTVVIRHKNTEQLGELVLTKTVETGTQIVEKESEYGNYQAIQFTQEKAAGIKFKVRATKDNATADNTIRIHKGEFVQYQGSDLVLTTDENGQAKSPVILTIGDYELVEIEAPAGIVLAEEPIPFSIDYAGQSKTITSTSVLAENDLQEISIYGHKQQEVITDWQDGTATIELEAANDGQVFALKLRNELKTNDVSLNGGSTLGYAVVKEGVIAFEHLKLPAVQADYYLEEIDAGANYQLPEQPNNQYSFTYTPATNDKGHEIHVWRDSFAENKQAYTRVVRQPIINELARANVKLLKVDQLTQKPLENVVFKLIRLDGEKKTVIRTDATNKNGEISISNLPTGEYQFVETRPLALYNATTEPLPFKVNAENNGTTIELVATNEKRLPQMGTTLATIDGKTENIDFTKDQVLRDEVSHTDYEKGTYVRETEIWEVVEKEGKTNKVGEQPIATVSTTINIDDNTGTTQIEVPIPANTLKENTTYECIERDYQADEQGKKKEDQPYASHGEKQLGNHEQQVTTMKANTVKNTSRLPQTGEYANGWLLILGVLLLVIVIVWLIKGRENQEQPKEQ